MMEQECNPVTHVYPDSRGGVLMMLKENTTFPITGDERAEADPAVDGVWLVHLTQPLPEDDTVVVAYLAGYRDPWGRIREHNDFESGRLVKGAR